MYAALKTAGTQQVVSERLNSSVKIDVINDDDDGDDDDNDGEENQTRG